MTVLNRLAVVKGAALAIAICLPLTIVGNVLHDNHPDSVLLPVTFVGVIVGFGAAGFMGARSEGDAPYSNGAFAALLAFLVIQVIAIVVRLVGGDPLHYGRMVGTALIAYAAGIIGALVAQKV